MKRSLAAVSLVALGAVLYACADSTSPVTPDEADEALATTIAATGVDPNAETTGGHAPSTKPAPPTCTFDATTKWMTCTSTQNGLTIKREIQYLDSKGIALSKPDTTVASMKAKTTVTGTMTIKTATGSGTTTVSRNSEETVTGLQRGSKERVVNGTGSGTEDSKVTDSRGTMTMKRTYSDTTKDLTLPTVTTTSTTSGSTATPPPTPVYPTAGTITRNSKATGKLADGSEKTWTIREVREFEAGGKLTVTTIINGVTHTCVFDLTTRAKPTCTSP